MVELKLQIAVSRCMNKSSSAYLTPVFDDLCEACDQKKPALDDDTLKLGSFIKYTERPDVLVQDLLATHCRKCDQFNRGDGMCEAIHCNKPYPIQTLMRNPATICELGLWK